MPAGLKRIYGQGHLHFITFSCYQRLPLLRTVRARDIFVQELGKLRDEMAFRLIGYVVMPEHVHLLERTAAGDAFGGVAEVETLRSERKSQPQDPGSKKRTWGTLWVTLVCDGGNLLVRLTLVLDDEFIVRGTRRGVDSHGC